MQIPFTFLVILEIAVMAQAWFAAGLLLVTRHNHHANRWLSLLLVAIALWLVDDFFRITGLYQEDPDLYFLPIYYSFAFGPLLYFYVRTLVNQQFVFEWRKHGWHFLPVLLQASLYIFLSAQSYEIRRSFWIEVHFPYTYRLEFDGTWLSLMIYGYLTFRIIRRYQAWIQEQFSEIHQIRLNGLRILLVLVMLLCVNWLGELVLRDGFNIYDPFMRSPLILMLIAVAMGIFGIRQVGLGTVSFDPAHPPSPSPTPSLDADLLRRIQTAFERDHLHLQPQLSLSQLADHLGAPAKAVSQHINQGFDQSFNEYVNRHRVETVMNRIQQGDAAHFTLLALALDAGFNSKTSFNRLFKQYTSLSPSAYKAQHAPKPNVARPTS